MTVNEKKREKKRGYLKTRTVVHGETIGGYQRERAR
jgi:hypothetical protein